MRDSTIEFAKAPTSSLVNSLAVARDQWKNWPPRGNTFEAGAKMTQIITTKQLLQIGDIEAILEDNLPQFPVETEKSFSEVAATFRVQKSSNVGAKISLSVHSYHFGPENCQKLKEAGIENSLIDVIQQSTDARPILADHLRTHLKQLLGSHKAKDLWHRHRSAIDTACGVNSSLVIEEWDPHPWLGAGFISGYSIAFQNEFVGELFTLLTKKIEHEPQSSQCFIATAASGDAGDPNVVVLQHFRDSRLANNYLGRFVIRLYSAFGPMLARLISRSRLARRITYRMCVRPSACLVRRWDTLGPGKDEK